MCVWGGGGRLKAKRMKSNGNGHTQPTVATHCPSIAGKGSEAGNLPSKLNIPSGRVHIIPALNRQTQRRALWDSMLTL